MTDKIKITLDEGAFMPERAHKTDAGIDLKAMHGGVVNPGNYAVFDTGVHVQLPPNTCGVLIAKSGLNTKKGITTTGLIDEGFTGTVRVAVHNDALDPYMVMAGDKITQLVVLPVFYPEIELVDEITGGERGDNGYGSTGR